MNRRNIKKSIQRGSQYCPITWNGVFLAVAAYWCFKKINGEKATADAPSSFAPFLELMGKTALWLLMAFVAFSLLSTLFCYLYFIWLKQKKDLTLSLQFDQRKKGGLIFQILFRFVRRPWLGAVRCRLVYDDGALTSKLTLLKNFKEKQAFFRSGIRGKQVLRLPDVKSYYLNGCFVYFEDWLHLFSFTSFIGQKGHFFQAPQAHKVEMATTPPHQVLKEEIHVEESKPVQGDYLNYKNFEGGDDIRRIVWQVYAKSRELMVRIPEMKNFYASELNFYASFHTRLPAVQTTGVYAREMLNYYKNCVWSAIQELIKREIPLKYIADQVLEAGEETNPEAKIRLQLSSAVWQTERELPDYFNVRNQGILCISSFNSVAEVRQLLEVAGKDTIIYFVPLTQAFHHFVGWTFLKRIFIKSPTDRLKRIRSRWLFTPLRFQLKKRETRLKELLSSYDVRFGILKF